jgi:hypothetical protein
MGYPGICFLKSDFPGTPFHRGRDIVILSIRFLSLVGLEDEGCDVVDWVCISNPRKHFGIDHHIQPVLSIFDEDNNIETGLFK